MLKVYVQNVEYVYSDVAIVYFDVDFLEKIKLIKIYAYVILFCCINSK